MSEINLLEKYPQSNRPVEERGATKTDEDRAIGRQFGKEYFDGDRRYGYGGYKYDPKYWEAVVPDIVDYYGLDEDSSILDVGCAKGFLLKEFKEAFPGMTLAGIDISQYAIDNAHPDVKPFLQVASAVKLPFEDQSFDLVISINTIHNLPLEECKEALREITRVSRRDAFITVDAYRNDEEKQRMEAWNLTAQTVLHVDEWKKLFKEVGYQGDYYWFIP